MAWQDVAAKIVQGAAGAAGNTNAQAEVDAWQQRKQGLEDEQRNIKQSELDKQAASGAITPVQWGSATSDLYAHEPAESRLGRLKRGAERIVGMKKQADAQKAQADAKLAAQPSPKADYDNTLASAKSGEDLYKTNPAYLAEQQKAADALALQQEKNKGMQNRPPAGRPVPFGNGSISAKDAKGFADSGMVFNDQDGNPLDVSNLPEQSKVTPWAYGGKIFYTVGDQKPRVITADNQRTVQPEEGALTPAGTAPTLGVARVSTASTHQVPGMNPGETVTLHGTTTPVTPGAKPAPTSAAPSAPRVAAPAPARATRPAPRQAQDGSPTAAGVMPPPPTPFAPGTMLAQGRATKPIVAKADVVAANVFGGGDEKPIWDAAWMFDRPDLRAALNKALTMNALQIPGTEDDPSFRQQLASVVGLTGASQEKISQSIVDSKDDLRRIGGPEAMKMFARMAGMQEDLTALRAVTGATAGANSIKTMVRAAPVYNVSSAQNFRDQLGATLNTAAKALHAYPEINPAYIQWWDSGAQMARGGTSQRGPAPKAGGNAKHYVGEPVTLKNGQQIIVKKVYPDGSFE
jgi:hypothetical protein